MIKLVPLFILCLVLIGCSTTEETDSIEERPVYELYSEAQAQMNEENYRAAAALFDDVERLYPYSEWAARSILMAAHANYQALEYDATIVALNRFIDLYPGNKDAPYAYYLRAVSFYEQIVDVGRDQELTERAQENLQDVIRRFPDSQYARDARLKLDLVSDHLAGKEMEIGRFYLKRKHYQSAINRFKTVAEKYDTTSHIPEALHRMVEAYMALGLKQEAVNIAAVLGHNYPGSTWYQVSYALVHGDEIPDLASPSGSTIGSVKKWFGFD